MAAPHGTPHDWGGTDLTFAATGVRSQVVHSQLVGLSADLTVLLDILEGGASTTDGIVKHFVQETDDAIDYDNAITFGADFNETDPQIQTKDFNMVQKIRRSATLSQESLKDSRLGPAQDQKMLQAQSTLRKLTRDTNAALYWSKLVNTDEVTAQKMRGLMSAIDDKGTGYGGAGNNTDAAAFTEDNVVLNILEKTLLGDAGFAITDVIFPQNTIKYVNTFSGFFGTTNAQVLRGNTAGASRGSAVSTYDAGYSENGGPVSFHFERGSYLDIDPSADFVAAANSEHCVGIHRPMWELCNFEPGTMFWREPMVVGGYRWHCEAYRSLTLLDRASYHAGASMTNMTGVS